MSSKAPLYWMALGAFAVGTESFMIAAVLPDIAADLAVSGQAAGQLVTIFALTYALTSPVLTVATGAVSRRLLLVGTMAAFAVANLVAAVVPSFAGLMAARVLLALGAGLFVPNASAVAGSLVPPAERGRALSIVTSGLSLAIVFGVPLGAVVGASLGWRATFVGVAALAVVATIGLLVGLPRSLGTAAPVVGLGARLVAFKNPAVRRPLAVMLLWAIGPFTVYPYLAILVRDVTGLDGAAIGIVLLVWGFSAFVGLTVGGRLTDRVGPGRVVRASLPLLALALAALSVAAHALHGVAALALLLAGIVVWGFTAWSFFPGQQARLIAIAGVANAPAILSANASVHYFGFSLGAALGSAVIAWGSIREVGWVGAVCVALAVILELSAARDRCPALAPAA
ncbi:MFS transporter [Rhodoplanes elegans]|uniref:MFS transporter n=1 Tax=Rhodoplanes elegans TaxID=29408 RepID=A0A327KYC8_9BRAD|nr:MFS transporter [Rhodoplanes elegans]MBK5959241.1 MFS transporter [Rhodoplanes elegans]RAI42172.1 MFS transporter [Rhodoplanes elegans]